MALELRKRGTGFCRARFEVCCLFN